MIDKKKDKNIRNPWPFISQGEEEEGIPCCTPARRLPPARSDCSASQQVSGNTTQCRSQPRAPRHPLPTAVRQDKASVGCDSQQLTSKPDNFKAVLGK